MTFTPGATYGIAYRLFRRFGWQNQLLTNFSRGIVRDLPRSAIPVGGVYDLVDLLVDSPGIAAKRGPVALHSTGVGAAAGPFSISTVPFDSTHIKQVAVADSGSGFKAYDCPGGGGAATVITGTANVPVDPPKFLQNGTGGMLVLLDFGAAAPQKITLSGTTCVLDTLGGSPPQGRVGCVHLSRFLIANTAANPNRIYFGPVPDVESTWDTDNAYIDVDEPVAAMASIAGVLLVWSKSRLWRIIGTLPPGDPNENMQLQPVADVGTFDGRSVTTGGSLAYFAGDSGVYETNGAGVTSLTEKKDSTGISDYWRSLSKNFTSGSVFALGLFKERYLMVSYTDATGPNFYCFACYLPNVAWTRFSGGFAHMYASQEAFYVSEKLLGCSVGTNKVFDMSAMFEPSTSATTNVDADSGQPPQGKLVTGVLGVGYDLKAFGHAHVTYSLVDNTAPTNPTLSCLAASGLSASVFFGLPETPLPETADIVRRRLSVNRDSEGVSLWFAEVGSASIFEIRAIELESRAYGELAEVP